MSEGRIFNVLFLCTGNSARSILAEVLLNRMGNGRFRAWSAGSYPRGKVHPLAIEVLVQQGLPVSGLRSKSWDEFSQPGAPQFDFIFTVCDNAAGEVCPVWPGRPMTAHWGIPDPAAAEGSDAEKRKAFVAAYDQLQARLAPFISLPIGRMNELSLKRELERIGAAETAAPPA